MQHDPSEMMDALMVETKRALADLAATTDHEQRLLQSETIRNLCESLGVFFDAMNDAMSLEGMYDFDDDEEYEEER